MPSSTDARTDIGVELEPRDDGRGAERAIEPRLAVAGAKIAVTLARGIDRDRERRSLVGRVRRASLVEPRGKRRRCGIERSGMGDGNHA